MLPSQIQGRERPPYLNTLTLHGQISSRPVVTQDEGYPLQLQMRIDIWMRSGRKPMTQPIIFLDPTADLIDSAMEATGNWAYATGRVASAVIDGKWETHVLGSEIEFSDTAWLHLEGKRSPMDTNELQLKLADHLVRYDFRKRDDSIRIVGNAQIGVAAAAYVVKLAHRLGQEDLATELNAELNEHLRNIEGQRAELDKEFDGTGFGEIDRWFEVSD